MGKVSVIMTSYNKPDYIGKAIQGVLDQTHADWELLLMDDHSDEATTRVIAPYLRDSRIRYVRSDPLSVEERASAVRYAVAINKALGMCEGDYVTYATDDNVYRPARLAKMSGYLDERADAQIVYSASITTRVRADGTVEKAVHRPAGKLTWLAPCAVDHCSVMHRRSILQPIFERWGTYWDENPAFYRIGDARFFWRLNQFWPFYPLNEVLDDNYMTDQSFHSQLFSKDKSRLVELLPPQRECRELREDLRRRQSEAGR
ncbi:glycosyltransferase family 2 protein [Cohnella sp. GCM10020058]|uniref:glycosyltransferase family 2 protein n=1 Tax=Cohnella sp. GCM10020058 TaxID=3317330 RepID=UPI003628C77E